MKCPHCKDEIGNINLEHDEYDLMKSHIFSCTGKVGIELAKSLDNER